jgi:hypothetical protein
METFTKFKVAGRQTNAYTKLERIDVGDIAGHQLSLTVAEGVNMSTGDNEFLNGAQLVSINISDLINFNGSFQGYTKFTKKDDIGYASVEGKITTTLSPEGNPVATLEGTFTWTKGTGQFKNLGGNGTFKGRYLTMNIYTVDWEGEYWLGK